MAAIHPFMERIKPVARFIKTATVTIGPHATNLIHQAESGWAALEPYHPAELLPALLGLVLCFFGGAYVTTITAFEAFRAVAYDDLKHSLSSLWEQYKLGQAAADQANPPDASEDETRMFTRKLFVAVQACDPDVVNCSLVTSQAGLMAVVAVLRIKFAQTITFGASMGSQMEAVAGVGWLPKQLELAIPAEYHKWIPTLISYGCRIVGITCAWTVQRAMFAFHTSIRGGRMLARGGLRYAGKLQGFDPKPYEATANFVYLEAALAGIGFYAQFVRGFSGIGWIGMVLFPIFLPLNICEFVIGMVIGRAA